MSDDERWRPKPHLADLVPGWRDRPPHPWTEDDVSRIYWWASTELLQASLVERDDIRELLDSGLVELIPMTVPEGKREYEIQVWEGVQWLAWWPSRKIYGFRDRDACVAELARVREKYKPQQFRLVSWIPEDRYIEDV